MFRGFRGSLASTMRALVYNYDTRVVEKPLPPIPRGWVLVRVEWAAWTGLEEAIVTGRLGARPGIVVGHAGYGVVVELGVAAPSWLAGKKVAVGRLPAPYTIPLYREKLWALMDEVAPLPGIVYNGWFAEYVALPSSALTEITIGLEDEKYYALSTPAAIAMVAAHWLATRTRGERYAVVGGGLVAIMTALAAQEVYDYELTLYTSDLRWKRLAEELGVQIEHVKKLGDHTRPLAAVFIATLDAYDSYRAVESVRRDGDVLLHPVYVYETPPALPRCNYRLITSFPADTGVYLLRKLGCKKLEKLVAVVDVLERPPIPRPKPALIVRVGAGKTGKS